MTYCDPTFEILADRKPFVVGQLVRISSDGHAWVDFPGNPAGPAKARTIVEIATARTKQGANQVPVLLGFEDDDVSKPIILGFINDRIRDGPASGEAEVALRGPRHALVDGETVILDANQEIELRCGQSSISLRKDGRILLRGTEIISRSSGANKLRGASVCIN